MRRIHLVSLTLVALAPLAFSQSRWVKFRDTFVKGTPIGLYQMGRDVISGDTSLPAALVDHLRQPVELVGDASGLSAGAASTVLGAGDDLARNAGTVGSILYDTATLPVRIPYAFSDSFIRTAVGVTKGENVLDVFASPLAGAIRAAREQHIGEAQALPPSVRAALRSVHTEATLERAKYVIGDPRVALPDAINFVETWSGWGHAVVVDDVIVFSQDPGMNVRWWAHEVTHVAQYARLGVEEFARTYLLQHEKLEREADELGRRAFRSAGLPEAQQQAALMFPVTSSPVPPRPPPSIWLYAHVEGKGDVGPFPASAWAGTMGQSLRLEFVRVECSDPSLKIVAMAHIEGVGDTPWQDARTGIGTRGEGKRIEGLAFRIEGPQAGEYEIRYRTHIQGVGDTRFFTDGEFSGTRGFRHRVEACQVYLRRR